MGSQPREGRVKCSREEGGGGVNEAMVDTVHCVSLQADYMRVQAGDYIGTVQRRVAGQPFRALDTAAKARLWGVWWTKIVGRT